MWWLRMNTQAKINYNKDSALKLGWLPSWFDVDVYNEELIEKEIYIEIEKTKYPAQILSKPLKNNNFKNI